MKEQVEARVTQEFPCPAEQVFDAWIQPAQVRAWLCASLQSMGLPGYITRVEIDPRVGGKFTFADRRDSGEAVHWGTYKIMDRPDRLEFTWFTSKEDERENASDVCLAITPRGTGCAATLTHKIPARWAEYIPQTEKGWGAMLAHCVKID